METVLAALLLAAVVVFIVTGPLRRSGAHERAAEDRRAALEAAKEAKYRDIRDAELDYRMGKLSEDDWRAADRELRTQAIAILHELDQLDAAGPGDEAAAADAPELPKGSSNGSGDG